ncbi:CD1108 family mobile element protein [Clostridium cochlearium]|uniref:CD1108 family mobile element protein n=1 Tax=Clostridium cochlearium TaxID=1494 RepID=UPI000DF10906|nr:hypothetical protein [Clostridium cochlearium]STA93564.1 NLP/P60 protein [Clostridium cochlearium]
MKDKNKGKKRKNFDIATRKKEKDYQNKRTKESERFQESIIEKESKLNNFDKEPKPTAKKGGLFSSQNQIEKHMSKDETANKLTTDSKETKGSIRENRKLDVGNRKKSSNYLDKRVHAKDKFQGSIIKKESKLRPKISEEIKKENIKSYKSKDEQKVDYKLLGASKSSEKDLANKKQQKGNSKDKDIRNERLDKNTDEESLFKEEVNDTSGLAEPGGESLEEDYSDNKSDPVNLKPYSQDKAKGHLKKKIIYRKQKEVKNKDGKLTTDDIKDLKGLETDEKKEKVLSQAKGLSGRAEKQYRKRKSKLIQEGKKFSKLYNKPKYDKLGRLVGGISGTSYMASEYLRSGSDENAAIDASEKGLYLSGSLTRQAQNKLQRQRRNPVKLERKLEIKHEKNLARAEYRTEIKGLKDQKDFQKKTAYKKLLKRRQMKKKIYEEHNIAIGFKERLKKGMENILKGTPQLIRRNIRKLLILLAIAIIGFMTLSQVATFFLAGISSVTSQVMSTTYLSSEDTLEDINSEFTKLEYELADELANIESYYPGYDEYRVGGDTDVGHDIHELLSFITAKHGEITNVSSLSGELQNLFNKMYKVDYETIVETRYRQVCYGSGEDMYCVMEPYDWYILKVTVTKKEIDTVAREEFAGYDENLAHYEGLLETGGNMEEYFGGSGITPVIPDSTIIGELVNNPDLSDKEKALVLAAYRTPTAGGGYCAAWVSNVYVNAGLPRPGGNANDQYYWYCNSSDLSELRPGMIVAVPTHNHTEAGKKYGHVGIYVGNGIIRENIGIVKDTKLSDWIAYYGSSARWGFPY